MVGAVTSNTLAQGAPSIADRPADSVEAAAVFAGRAAADQVSVTGTFTLAALGGVTAVLGGVWLASEQRGGLALVVTAAGVALVGTSFGTPSNVLTLPVDTPTRESNADVVYRQAFQTAYQARLRQRQRRAAARGTLTGIGVGALSAYWLLANALK